MTKTGQDNAVNGISVMFVCLGNICRSPAAEEIARHKFRQAGVTAEFSSSGTSAYHSGNSADTRMIKHAARRGIRIQTRSKPFNPSLDLEEYDLILAMDESVYRTVYQSASQTQRQKVKYFTEFCTLYRNKNVPDPYYGGEQGFERVLDIVDDGCEGLLHYVQTSDRNYVR